MALLYAEGFEGYSDIDQYEESGGVVIPSYIQPYLSFGSGRNGGQSLINSGGVFQEELTIPFTYPATNNTPVIAGFAIKFNNAMTNGDQLFRIFGDLFNFSGLVGQSGSVLFYTHIANNLNIGSYPIVQGKWYYFEIKYYADNINGIAEFKVNEEIIFSWSGDNYYVSRVTPYCIKFGWNGWMDYQIDDVYVVDTTGTSFNDYLGDIRIDAIFPSAAGNYSQLTPSAGNNYECVDESSFDDTDYVYSANSGDKDSYDYDAVPTDLDDAAIYTLRMMSFSKRTVASDNIKMKHLIRQGGVDYVQSEQSLADDNFSKVEDFVFEDPSDSNPWTKAKINSAEFGVEVG